MPAFLKARWFWYSLCCMLCFAGWMIVSKMGVDWENVPDRTMFYLFIWGSLPVAVALLAARKFRLEKSAKGISNGILIGIFGGAGQLAVLIALAVPDANTSVISAVSGLYPMVTVVLAVLLLRERLAAIQVGGVGSAAAAIVIFAQDPKAPFAFDWSQGLTLPAWFGPVAVVLAAWGIVGIFQKLATNHISPAATLIWQTAGFFVLLPFVFPEQPLGTYTTAGLAYGLLGGIFTNLGSWFLFAALGSGGKVSIVAPFCALYPLIVVFVAPRIFQETITWQQLAGVGCAVAAIVLLSLEPQPEAPPPAKEPSPCPITEPVQESAS